MKNVKTCLRFRTTNDAYSRGMHYARWLGCLPECRPAECRPVITALALRSLLPNAERGWAECRLGEMPIIPMIGDHSCFDLKKCSIPHFSWLVLHVFCP